MILKLPFILFLLVVVFLENTTGQCTNGNRGSTSNCVGFGNFHLKTFDGKVLSYTSQCGYTLASINSNGINFEINRLNPTTLQIKYGTHTFQIKITGNTIELLRDEKQQTIPHSSFGVTISKPGSMVVATIEEIGIKIRYDGKTIETLINNEKNENKISGMCGNNDGCPENDLVLKNGDVTTSQDQFANSWSLNKCTTAAFVNNCGTNARLKTQAEVFCNNLFNNEKFAKCGTFTSQFMNICTANYCNCKLANRNDCMCDMLDAFSKTCQAKINENISWRNSKLCPIECRIPDQEFMSCAPNKVQLSCGEDEIDTSKRDCEEGCYCPLGLRLFRDKCVLKDECPCLYNDNVYNPGSSIAQDCNTCVCKKGKWDCTTKTCTVDGHCVADPHYTTFDGKRYDFMGKCTYYLVRGTGFDVMCDHYIWNGAFKKDFKSNWPSYCAKVIVQIKDDIIELGQRHDVKVNGNKVDWFPFTAPGFRIAQPSSLLTTVTLKNSVVVDWNGNSRAGVTIPTTMKGRVNGLLGTYTKNQDDDFLMPDGKITKDPLQFGNSWKVPGSCENEFKGPVPHPCGNNPTKKAKAEKACAPLKSGLFDGCLDDIKDDYENCLYDSCLCPEEQKDCICEFYAMQGTKCAAKGIYVDWRRNITECAIKCPAGQTYQVCGNPCTRSCEDIVTKKTCEKKCVEGCTCPEGKTLNVFGECVPIRECTCVFLFARFAQDFTFIDEDNKQTCNNADWDIDTATKDDKDKYPSWDDLKSKCNADEFLEYSGCMRTNTVTCQNKHLNEPPNYKNCKSGCQCMSGFVYDPELKMCIRPDDCPCIHNGISYLENTERTDRNEKCICKNGFWTCTEQQDHWEKCSVWGNIHVRTFDELVYSFKGFCEYILLQDTVEEKGLFRVTLMTEKCNVGACIKQVNVYYKDVNGKEEEVVFTTGVKFVHPGELSNLIISDLDLSIIVNVVNLGVKIVWNKSGWVHIHVSRDWILRKNHFGLCGKYDDNPGNDLETPKKKVGVTHLVDYSRFGKSCPGCTKYEEVNLLLPEDSCDILHSEVFKTCRLLKPVKDYYNRCLIDANLQLLIPTEQRFNYYCQTLSAYAQECNDVDVPVNWRTNNICPFTCENNKIYKPCESSCPKRTCKNEKEFLGCKDKLCSEACNLKPCPENTIYKDDLYEKCVKQDCNDLETPCKQNIDVYLDCNNKKCGLMQLILNIHTKNEKK